MPNIVSICGGVRTAWLGESPPRMGAGARPMLAWPQPGGTGLGPPLLSVRPSQVKLPHPKCAQKPGGDPWEGSPAPCCVGWCSQQRLGACHVWDTGTPTSSRPLPALGWAPSLTSRPACRARISAQAPVIRAMCTENTNRPFHQLPAPSPQPAPRPDALQAVYGGAWPPSARFRSLWAGAAWLVCCC